MPNPNVMIDLFALAQANAPELEHAYADAQSLRPQADQSHVQAFVDWVDNSSRISINVRVYLVAEIVTGGKYQNIYDWADEQAAVSGQQRETILRERLKQFFDKRISFDNAFENGDSFLYGALNCGGLGLSAYGSCCMVLTQKFEKASTKVAYLNGDSLKVCVDAHGAVNELQVRQNSAPSSHRAVLAAIKHSADLKSSVPADWATLLFGGGSYMEAVFVGNVLVDSLECVRMSAVDYQRHWDMAFSSFGKSFNEAERALIHDFVQIMKAHNAAKPSLVVI